MKNTLLNLGGMFLAVSLFGWNSHSTAQVTVTESATTSAGTITEFAPGQTLILRTERSPEPVRYRVTKETTVVDETGAPVKIDRVTSGVPVAVHYTRSGDGMVVSRIVVKRAAPLVEERTTTTTTTTEDRKLSHEEKERLEKARHEEKERLEKQEKELRK